MGHFTLENNIPIRSSELEQRVETFCEQSGYHRPISDDGTTHVSREEIRQVLDTNHNGLIDETELEQLSEEAQNEVRNFFALRISQVTHSLFNQAHSPEVLLLHTRAASYSASDTQELELSEIPSEYKRLGRVAFSSGIQHLRNLTLQDPQNLFHQKLLISMLFYSGSTRHLGSMSPEHLQEAISLLEVYRSNYPNDPDLLELYRIAAEKTAVYGENNADRLWRQRYVGRIISSFTEINTERPMVFYTRLGYELASRLYPDLRLSIQREAYVESLYNAGRVDDAEHEVAVMISEGDEANSGDNIMIGRILARTNRPEDALVYFRRVTSTESEDVEPAYLNLIKLLISLGRLAEANQELDRFEMLDFGDQNDYVHDGINLLRRQIFEQALSGH